MPTLSSSQLEILITAVDNASSVLQQVSGELNNSSDQANTASTNWADVGKQMGAAAVALAPIAAAFDEIAKDSITSAANLQTAVTNADVLIAATVNNANNGADTLSVQIAKLKAQIAGYQGTIDTATASLDKNTGTAEASAAAHAKAQASIDAAQANIETYTQKLDLLENQQGLVGQSSSAIESQFLSTADANTNLGITVEDSMNALGKFFSLTNSTTDAMAAYNLAVNLSLVPGQNMTSATTAVAQALNGTGRALSQIVPGMKDGLAGMDAINAATSVLGGESAAQSQTFNVQIAALNANWGKLMATFGATDLGPLTKLLDIVNNIINAVNTWAEKNPDLAGSIETVVIAMAAVLSAGVAILGIMAAIGIIVIAMGGVFAAFAVAIVLVAAVVVAAIALILTHWTELCTLAEALWKAFMYNTNNEFIQLKNEMFTILDNIGNYWNATWKAIGDFFGGIWTNVQTTLSNAVTAMKSVINSFVSWAEGVFQPVMTAVNAIGGAASSFGKAVTNVVSGVVKSVDDAIISPGGDIVTTSPQDYLIATKNPSGLFAAGAGGGGAMQIVVNIQGGNYLDSNGANTIAAALAKKIQQNLKLTNFR